MNSDTKTKAQPQDSEETEAETDKARFEKDYILETGSVLRTKGRHAIHCLTVIGQIEGHSIAPQTQKTTKYEHVIPQLVSIEEDPEVEGLLVILNTVGGDVEAGLALGERISGITKPSATLVLGGGHSIGIPLAVSARRSFIVPTATMTVHPVRHSGLVLGVPQTMRYFEQMQQRITGFVAGHSHISEARFTELMMHTGELVMDMAAWWMEKQLWRKVSSTSWAVWATRCIICTAPSKPRATARRSSGKPEESRAVRRARTVPGNDAKTRAGLPQGRAKACSRNGSNCTSGAFGGTMYKYQCAKMRKSHACGA